MRLVVLCTATLVIVPAVVVAKPASGVKWVPLNQSQNGPAKKSASTESAIETSRSAQSASSPEVAQHQPATTAPSAPQAPSGPLQLTCLGAGTANKLKSTSVFGSGNQSGIIGSTLYSGNSSGSATIIGTQDRPFEDQVDLRLFNGDDRIRMPRTMLPPIHGGNGGWFKLKNVVADERSIRGKAAVSLMNNPNVFIDRVTGSISISGYAGDYAGQCQVIDANAVPKF